MICQWRYDLKNIHFKLYPISLRSNLMLLVAKSGGPMANVRWKDNFKRKAPLAKFRKSVELCKLIISIPFRLTFPLSGKLLQIFWDIYNTKYQTLISGESFMSINAQHV